MKPKKSLLFIFFRCAYCTGLIMSLLSFGVLKQHFLDISKNRTDSPIFFVLFSKRKMPSTTDNAVAKAFILTYNKFKYYFTLISRCIVTVTDSLNG